MAFFTRIRTGLSLARSSAAIIKADPALLWFPVMSALGFLVALALAAAPGLVSGAFQAFLADAEPTSGQETSLVVGGLLLFFLSHFVMHFFNAALVFCALDRMNGGTSSVKEGLAAAVIRLPQILGWSLLSATVGFLLRALEQRSEFLGALVARIAGAAWALTSYLVVPVLVAEGVGPFAAFKRSARLFTQAWGERLAGAAGVGMAGFVLVLPGILAISGGLILLAQPNPSELLALNLIGIGAVLFGLALAISAALTTIFQSALYLFARDGSAPQGFTDAALSGAVRSKKK